MAWDALVGVVIGAALALVSAFALELWREHRNAVRAAQLIRAELVEIGMLAGGLNPNAPFPYPFSERAWLTYRDRLAIREIADTDVVAVISFYSTNELVAKGAMQPATCGQVSKETTHVIRALMRVQNRRPWHRFRRRRS